MKLSERLKCLVPARKKVDKYVRAVDQHHSTVESFRESHSKVRARQSHVDELMDETDDLMEELREQQEEVVRQVILAEHKPAWDDALRVVMDVAFDSMSSLSDVSEAIVEQLLEGGYLASEDHVAALLLVHPERHGHIFVAQCTEAAASYSARLTANAHWSPSSRNPLSVAAYSVLNSGEPLLSFCPDGGVEKWRVCPLQEKGGRTFGVLLSGCLGCDVRAEWLLEMAKLGGQMLEKVWRREQLETLIKVSQAWVQDHANEPRTPAIDFMHGHTRGSEPKKSSQAKGGKIKKAAKSVNAASRVARTTGKKSTGKLSSSRLGSRISRRIRRISKKAPPPDCEPAREKRHIVR
jgi:hypothetical protein